MTTNETHGQSLRAVAAAAMRENGFEPEFSPAAIAQVRALDEVDASSPRARTEDLRPLCWSSIDNPMSRDLDQVEHAERRDDDAIVVRLGIADVSSLVPVGSAADDHAATNTTSVYTGVTVFPMLPERLSTNLTSLNEGEDRLAFVIQFAVGADGRLSDETVYHALVRNRAKLSYGEVGAWLEDDGPAPAAIAASAELADQVRLQAEATRRLRDARVTAGALDFESVEASPVVANGKVIDLAVTQRDRARDLIEDLMVAANRCVATYLHANGSSSIRRVVRRPERWDRIAAIAAEHGVLLPPEPDAPALSAFLAERRAADPEHFADLSLSIIKLLGAGAYVVEPAGGSDTDAGHFGLAVADYVHSTAPNRRFPDLVTQRMLRATWLREPAPYDDDALAEIAEHSTERGKAARKVERTVRKMAGAALLAERVGDSFTAIITASSAKGMYARVLSPPVEGRIVRGTQGLDVGDTVRLTLLGVDAGRGHIDFAHEPVDVERKLQRSRRKKRMADALRPRIGETFVVEVTAAGEHGTWVRALDGSAEGRVIRGLEGLATGMTVPVRLVKTDSVHGFIDFEYVTADVGRKDARRDRKRAAARTLAHRIGDTFDAVVTGVSRKATWIETTPEGIEGRLVRGTAGLQKGDRVRVVLLVADARRGYIDFAREDAVVPVT
ncbi:MAG TPA: RNB domain-containing ribonuclease [Longimicrobiales bacterium]|nr:RNB domain-containing ribonuclease [Longimicrobiales bacterium]